MLDWLKAQIFHKIRKQFEYFYKNSGTADCQSQANPQFFLLVIERRNEKRSLFDE